MLIGRDAKAMAHYLPKLRAVRQLHRDAPRSEEQALPGRTGRQPAGPSYAGWKKPDGTLGKAYLAGLSITYIAALDRLIELEKLAGNRRGELYTQRRDLARKGLALFTTDEGYFIKSLDPDGTKHGVYGAAKHGYFEAVCNHDAICFRVADDAQAEKIYAQDRVDSRPAPARPDHHQLPGLDDMYQEPTGLLAFGTGSTAVTGPRARPA